MSGSRSPATGLLALDDQRIKKLVRQLFIFLTGIGNDLHLKAAVALDKDSGFTGHFVSLPVGRVDYKFEIKISSRNSA